MLDKLLLGLLREKQSGYDLKLLLRDRLPHIWKAELAQIYPLLQKLEASGQIASQSGRPKAGPSRKLYSRTPAGTRFLKNWLRDRESTAVFDRNPTFAFLLIAGQDMNKAELMNALGAMEKSFRNLGSTLAQIEQSGTHSMENQLRELARRRSQVSADWCREVRAELSQGEIASLVSERDEVPLDDVSGEEAEDFIGRFD